MDRQPSLQDLTRLLGRDRDEFDSLTGREIAEVLWLSLQMGETAAPPPEPDVLEPEPEIETIVEDAQQSEPNTSPIVETAPQSPIATTEAAAELYPQPPDAPTNTADAFAVPDPSEISDPLALARALRPLARRLPVGRATLLDEAATVDRVAETRVLDPVLRPATERWFDVALVVDSSASMALWHRFVRDLRRVLSRYGEFRDVRCWRLRVGSGNSVNPGNSGEAWLEAWHDAPNGDRRYRPSELLVGDRRRIVVVLSDCVDASWYSGHSGTERDSPIRAALALWAAKLPTAIFQVFPERLWEKTAIAQMLPAALRGRRFGQPSAALRSRLLSPFDRRDVRNELAEHPERRGLFLPLPIVNVEAASLAAWAQVVAGTRQQVEVSGGLWRSVVARSDDAEPDVLDDELDEFDEPEEAPLTPVEVFLLTASPIAKRLAGLLALAPVVMLPIVRLIRRSLLPEARTEHVAEVLTSGLLVRRGQRVPAKAGAMVAEADRDRAIYEFVDGDDGATRQRLGKLHDDLSRRLVIDKVSLYIAARLGLGAEEFMARLGSAEEGEAAGDREFLAAFARVMARDLVQLGGRYAAIATRLDPAGVAIEVEVEEIASSGEGTGEGAQGWPLEAFEFEYLELEREEVAEEEEAAAGEPFPLVSDPSEVAEIETVLERFEFETATIERKTGLRGVLQTRITLSGFEPGWTIRKRQTEAWGYTEWLDEEVAIELVAIPEGTFTIGAPETEPESYDNERPQVEVTLESFYMARTPVTQAQWRIVVGYPQIDRELDPDPSRFKGDSHPVEQVSWDEAVEFCQRLSAATGQNYRLPSEAQWEYACRAGTTTPFCFGETLSTDLANYNSNYAYNGGQKGEWREQTTEVTSLPANNWGLYDVHGNVWEWCADDGGGDYSDLPRDGLPWQDEKNENRTEFRRLRGGSWNSIPRICRSAVRNYNSRADRYLIVGFRVCCVPPRNL